MVAGFVKKKLHRQQEGSAMDMELAARAAFALPKELFWKIKYGGRLSLALVQSFGRGCVLRVGKEARASLGRETVSRVG